MKILLADSFDASLPQRLAKFGEVTQSLDDLAEAEIVLVRSKTKCDRAFIERAPKLKYIIRGGVGVDTIDLVAAKERGIKVENTAAASSVAVAEVAFALMLAVPNRLVFGHEGMTKQEWRKNDIKRTELFKKTLGLIGIGRIASEVATRAQAFGMRVIAYDKFVATSNVATMVTFDELLAEADYVSLHTPLTDETRGMFNQAVFAKMKKGAILINTGRGKCVVEEDLAQALASGQLGGYGTDVWYSDPPDWKSPILSAPNVTMLPHVGANSKENLLRIGDIVVEQIEAYTRNK